MQCYDYLLQIFFFANKGHIGCFIIIEHGHLYLVCVPGPYCYELHPIDEKVFNDLVLIEK